jgi:hypothetical protein
MKNRIRYVVLYYKRAKNIGLLEKLAEHSFLSGFKIKKMQLTPLSSNDATII